MAPTFILTRTFAISALFVGAFPISYAAPVPSNLAPRGCRQMSCLYALPGANADASANTTVPMSLQIPPGGFSQESMQMLDFLISALTSARSAAADAAAPATVTEVQPVVDAVTVGGFVPPVVEELAAKIAEGSVPAPVPAEEAAERKRALVDPQASLDALV